MNQRLHNVAHRTAPAGAVYIGRKSKWGNPFVEGRDGSREQVIAKFEKFVVDKLPIHELIGRDLICHCVPKDCHGRIILERIKALSVPVGKLLIVESSFVFVCVEGSRCALYPA